ncbi:MAG: CRTAC1 family protein, partial [Gemmatimonadales bacterium]
WDVSIEAGVREGYWGWASCFADFDNDGNLDLFHVNGMQASDNAIFSEYWADPSRLFISNGDGTFTERSSEVGLGDNGQGRGVVCFDADRDGDIDIFVANNRQPPAFYVNEGATGNNYLEIVLLGASPNTQGIGARIVVTAGGKTQTREIRAGGNYVSQDPAEAHFGLGREEIASEVLVKWPDGQVTALQAVAANQVVVIRHPGS